MESSKVWLELGDTVCNSYSSYGGGEDQNVGYFSNLSQ